MLETLTLERALPTDVATSGRLSRVDAILAAGLAAITLAVCLYFAPRGFQAGFVDMGQDGYQLRQVLDLNGGGVIFRDTFDQYGPLNGYLNTVGFVTLGGRLLAVKYFISGWYSLIAVALFVMARHWLSSALAAFSTIVWLGLAPFYQHGIMISPHVYVLLFQTLATIVTLDAVRLEPRRFAVVGVLAALSWSMKQSMGALFFLSILLYLLLRWVLGRDGWSQVAKATAAVAIAFFGVIGLLLALLWTQGALRDWYLQTIAFPRDFYIQTYAEHLGWAPGVRSFPTMVAKFVQLQGAEALYWVVIRAVVFVTAVVQVVRRRPADDLLLMASITAFLWLAAFPSSSFMHQWWTTSLTFAPFVVCVKKCMSHLVSDRAVLSATVAAVSLIVGPGVVDRVRATGVRTNNLTETMTEPPMLRGIRTDAPTKRAFETFYRLMARYRADHLGTRVVSIDSSDGFWTGVPESLLFLSFFDDNAHAQSVYWSLPVLSTTTYPQYSETLWREVSVRHPLIVDSHFGEYAPKQVPGYALLAAAQSDYGYWYLYASDEADHARPGVSTFLARDGSIESGFAERGAGPSLAKRLSSNVDGGWRGRTSPSIASGQPVELPGNVPFVLIDPTLSHAVGPVSVYTWPADLRIARLDRAIEPLSAAPSLRADIVEPLGAGAWRIDGQALDPYSYLLQFQDEPIARGASFIVRGELQEGGFQVGFVEDNQWSGYVKVTHNGLFEAVLEIQRPGRYRVTVANCIESSWWQTVQRHWIGGTVGLLRGPFLPNHFRISEAGWLRNQTAG